jgi:hypothetical protein
LEVARITKDVPLAARPGNGYDSNHKAIADAARELNEQRERALNADREELKTLTNLCNRMKAGELRWLANAHEKLDRAVFAAYGWPYPLDDQKILSPPCRKPTTVDMMRSRGLRKDRARQCPRPFDASSTAG